MSDPPADLTSLARLLRRSRLTHKSSSPSAPDVAHPFRLGENQLRLLHLLQLLGELPHTCRFVHVTTPNDIAGISPKRGDVDVDAHSGAEGTDDSAEDPRAASTSRRPAAVHDWVLAVFIHECIVHKVLDYELAPMFCSAPAPMMMQVPLEARHDLSQLVADGLIASFTLTSSRLAASTITGSPYTSGTQRGGRVRVLSLTPDGHRMSSLLLRTGSRELRSIVTADTDGVIVPRRILWYVHGLLRILRQHLIFVEVYIYICELL